MVIMILRRKLIIFRLVIEYKCMKIKVLNIYLKYLVTTGKHNESKGNELIEISRIDY